MGKGNTVSGTRQAASFGFTLVEVLVAITLFTIVVTTAVSALVVIIDANRKAQNISSTVNNAFFTFEVLTRLLRTGVNYHCGSAGTHTAPRDCVNGDNEVYFTDDRGNFVHVWHDTAATGSIMMEVDSTAPMNGGDFEPAYSLTSPDFDVETLLFHVTGSPLNDAVQPRTTIVMYGVTNADTQESSSLKLQSTVAQRMIDL
jgi:prepilin-type N-terminal cleavage/methylation domain-containing protein